MWFFGMDWFSQPWNILDVVSSAIVAAIIGLHFSCNAAVELLRGLAAIEVRRAGGRAQEGWEGKARKCSEGCVQSGRRVW